jgi:hypothetical protein
MLRIAPIADSADAAGSTAPDEPLVVENWTIVPTVGPFLLRGTAAGKDFFAVLLALDEARGLARLTDGWVRLGRRDGSTAPAAEVARRAALWLAEDHD